MSERRRAGRTLVPRSKPLADKAFLDRDAFDQMMYHADPWRALRILSEFVEGFDALSGLGPAISIFGSARTPREDAYYVAAERTGQAIAERGFAVITGGGPGIMEAANRGASEAHGMNVGLTISIPADEFDNPYVTRELSFHFHYFFMRKFWFAYLAKAVLVFPGGYGTLDELFELLTLVQTRKMRKPLPIVLFGTEYWKQIVDFDALARHGMISPTDIELVFRTDSVDEAYDWIVRQLAEKALGQPGATL